MIIMTKKKNHIRIIVLDSRAQQCIGVIKCMCTQSLLNSGI